VFPDIALNRTTAPELVPSSSSVRIPGGVDSAFADLLAVGDLPAPEVAATTTDPIATAAVPWTPLPSERPAPSEYVPLVEAEMPSAEAITDAPTEIAAVKDWRRAQAAGASTQDVQDLQADNASADGDADDEERMQPLLAFAAPPTQSLPPVEIRDSHHLAANRITTPDSDVIEYSPAATTRSEPLPAVLPAEPVSPSSPSAPVPPAIETDSARHLADARPLHVDTPTHVGAPENTRHITKESSAVTRLSFAGRARADEARARLAAMLGTHPPVGTHPPAAERAAVDADPSVAVSPPPDAGNQQAGADLEQHVREQGLDVHVSVRESVDATEVHRVLQAVNDGAAALLSVASPLPAQMKDRRAPSSILQVDATGQKSFFTGILNATHATSPSSTPRVMLPNETATTHAIVQTLRLQAASGGGTAVITLAPEYLGSVTVSLRVTDGGVVATLHAENASVRTWMESNVAFLKDGLAQQGLTLEQLVIADTSEPGRAKDDQTHRQTDERTPARRRQRREESTFEVVV
jgi:hypothetical protein